MPAIRIIRADRAEAAARLRELRRPLLLDRLVLDDTPEARRVQEIIADVRHRGDEAVADITARVDGAAIAADAVRVPPEEIERACRAMPADLRRAVDLAAGSVRRFQEYLLQTRSEPLRADGKTLAVRARPLRRVALCVPGAAAPLLSSVIHSGVPAQVAGVRELVVVAPPRHNGDIHPAILGVAGALGIREVYRMGGAHAMAALAMGTSRVPRVDKIVGPGGTYVQLAKRYLYGIVDIDMFAATTEVLIIADQTARPAFLAADMLAQAEHNPGCSVLLTTDESLVDRVLAELDRQLESLATAREATHWLAEYGAIVVVRDLDDAVALADEIAPEHLQIETANPRELAERIEYAGAIFLGHYSPESSGDYLAGPSHVLPTGGTARFWSGVSALSFLRYTSLTEYTRDGLAREADAIATLALAEHLDGHARSATIRVRD
jgi:histidinol dehydrogenase